MSLQQHVLPPKVWGGGWWTTMYSIAYTSTPEKMGAITLIFTEYATVIPCDICAAHYKIFLANNPIPRTRDALLVWVNNLHNSVNESIGTPQVPLSAKLIELETVSPKLVTPNAPLSSQSFAMRRPDHRMGSVRFSNPQMHPGTPVQRVAPAPVLRNLAANPNILKTLLGGQSTQGTQGTQGVPMQPKKCCGQK